MNASQSIIITGANRGIGLGFTQAYLQKGCNVIATYRSDAGSLSDFKKEFPEHLTLVQMDVAKKESIQKAFDDIAKTFSSIDILINNAGRYGNDRQKSFDGSFDIEDMALTVKTNALCPLLVVQAARPLLQQAQSPKVINISSKMGSIADNSSGGSYGYRASKTALNMVNKSMALELQDEKITCIAFHPGWVQTDMGGPNAMITVDESVQAMMETISKLTLDDTGAFLERTGEPIPW